MCPNKLSRLFAKNLNDFDIHLFGQTVYYSVSPSSNALFDPLRSDESPHFYVMLHFRYISDIS